MRLPDTIYIEEGVVIEGWKYNRKWCIFVWKFKDYKFTHKTNSVVESSIVKDSDVGPMARIRPDSKIVSTHVEICRDKKPF